MKQRENLHMTYEELREKYENPALQHYITKRCVPPAGPRGVAFKWMNK